MFCVRLNTENSLKGEITSVGSINQSKIFGTVGDIRIGKILAFFPIKKKQQQFF